MYVVSWFDEIFTSQYKHIVLEITRCCVEITEIFSHAFLAKISWKQRIY